MKMSHDPLGQSRRFGHRSPALRRVLQLCASALLCLAPASLLLRAETNPPPPPVVQALSTLQDVSQVQMNDGLRLLAFTEWPAGQAPQTQLVAYRITPQGIRLVYRETYDDAYCANLSLVYDYPRNLAPVLVLFINYGAAFQRALIFRFKEGVPYFVQDLSGGKFNWMPNTHPFLELYCVGSSAVDLDERYRWTGTRFEKIDLAASSSTRLGAPAASNHR